MKVGRYKGYDIYLSERSNKKYYALVDGKKVHFGDTRYEQYYDKMGHYSHLNHNDKKRRKLYKQRHEKDRHVIASSGYFADQILW